MSNTAAPPGTLRRRDLLTGLGAAALATSLPAQAALSTREVAGWDLTTDVLIAGSGAAGISAALEARAAGAEVLVRGARAPLVGRVSMDAVTVDVTDLSGLDYTEEFVLLGSQGDETITAGELARRRNTIPWEVLTSMAQRLARVYHPSAGTAGAD